MATKSTHLSILEGFGHLRRHLNVVFFKELRPHAIGPKQAILLRQLQKLQPASLAELSRMTLTNPAATGRAVDGLIKKGWIKQSDHPNDKRQWKLTLSPTGAEFMQKIEVVANTVAGTLCAPLSADEKGELLRLITKMSTHLSDKKDGGI